MKKKVLFTGGSGLLAINWAWHISRDYEAVLGLHNRNISVEGISAVKLQLDSAETFLRDLDQVRPDIVIHCAGLANVEQCEENPALAHHVNVVLSENIAMACKQKGIRLVYICTDHLFAGDKPLVTEEEPVAPVNVYGRTKWEGERTVLSVSDQFLSIRTNFYGWGTRYRYSFSDFIIKSLRDKKVITLFDDFYYTPILAEELADTVMQLLALGANGIYNVTGSERISKYEFGIRLAQRFGLDTSLIRSARLADQEHLVRRPADLSLSNRKAAALLDKTFYSLDESIDRLFRQEREGTPVVLSAGPIIPYGRQNISEEDIQSVVNVLRSDWLTQGPLVPVFEKAVASYCSAGYGVAVNSATSALHIACLALGVGKGDMVWTSPVTFVASANCVLYCGAEVDFVDIDPQTYNMSVAALRSKLEKAERENKLPKLLIPVHLSGQCCDMEAIHELGKQYGFKIIEDASHAIGGKYKGEPVGNCRYSDITVFSFHPVKIITTGEGGMAMTNDHKLAVHMAHLRSHGIVRYAYEMTQEPDGPWYYQQKELGFNYRMMDLQAALGLSQMKRIDEFVGKRQAIAKRYRERLSQPYLVHPFQAEDTCSAFHLYIIRIKKGNTVVNHLQLFKHLRAAGILVNLHYIPIYRQPFYEAMGFSPSDFPEAEAYYAEAITLPIHPSLTEEEQDFVIACVNGKEAVIWEEQTLKGFQNIF